VIGPQVIVIGRRIASAAIEDDACVENDTEYTIADYLPAGLEQGPTTCNDQTSRIPVTKHLSNTDQILSRDTVSGRQRHHSYHSAY
jgi:hypothetical protein